MGLIIRFFQILWWIFVVATLWSMIRRLYRLWKTYDPYSRGGGRPRDGRIPRGYPGSRGDVGEGQSAQGSAGAQGSADLQAQREMVPCATCGIFVERQSAIRRVIDGREVYYCSERCRG